MDIPIKRVENIRRDEKGNIIADIYYDKTSWSQKMLETCSGCGMQLDEVLRKTGEFVSFYGPPLVPGASREVARVCWRCVANMAANVRELQQKVEALDKRLAEAERYIAEVEAASARMLHEMEPSRYDKNGVEWSRTEPPMKKEAVHAADSQG